MAPLVPKLINNDKNLLPNCFSLLKICEALGVMIVTYLCGYLRQQTGSFFCVTLLMTLCLLVAIFSSYLMIPDQPGFSVLEELPKSILKKVKEFSAQIDKTLKKNNEQKDSGR